MLDLIILALFIVGLFIGFKRGLILQFIHLTGFLIAFLVAKIYYFELATKLVLWIPYPSFNGPIDMILENGNLEEAYYRGIAFVVIFFAVKIAIQIIGSMLDFIAGLPILKQFNLLAGGFLGFLEVYLIVFILLYIAALLPIEMIQDPLQSSILSEGIIKNTPFLSEGIKQLWIEAKP
jgi:uncharacterized membrane protein required for colicin V production